MTSARAAVRAAFLLAALIGGASCASEDGDVRAAVGEPAPTFETFDLDGEPVELADHRGDVVLLNFWASWCVPCRKEFPILAEVHERDDVTVLGVVFDDSEESARRFMEEQKASWPGLVDDGSIARAYGVARRPGIPVTVAIDASGVLRKIHIGEADRADLRELVDAASR